MKMIVDSHWQKLNIRVASRVTKKQNFKNLVHMKKVSNERRVLIWRQKTKISIILRKKEYQLLNFQWKVLFYEILLKYFLKD